MRVHQMMRLIRTVLRLWLVCFLFLGSYALAAVDDGFPNSPQTNAGKKWNIAYYEGGQDDNYYYYLVATIKGMMELGWIARAEIPSLEHNSTSALWAWLASNIRSDYLNFVNDGHYSADWDESKRQKMRTDFIGRLNNKADIDLVLAMGTWAGIDLATEAHSVPTMVMSTSDPVGAGIIKSIDDSGYNHVHARVDPKRYERQVRIFHDIIGFKRLGVAYENSIYGRSYAAIELIEKVAKERGFEIVVCYTKSDIANLRLANESVLKCFADMADKVDAIYVTIQGGVNTETIPKLVGLTNQYRIPTFYQRGSDGVKQGFLLSISRAGGFKPVGLFLAATIGKIFNGATPRQLKQLFQEAPNIAINLKTAEIIGLYLYADVLAAADEIYREISTDH